MKNNQIAIIGAGPAGLTAAYEFIRRGLRPLVLDRHDRVGGLSRTESYKGFYFDVGGHRFFTKIPGIKRLWHDMLGHDLLRVSRMSRIFYNGRFFKYPLDPLNVLVNLGLSEGIMMPLSYIRAQILPYPDEDTFDQWICNRFGRRLYLAFFKTYTEKVWGMPCSRIRADWAAQRIKGLSFMAAVMDSILKIRTPKTLINEFYYPVKGSGMMWDRLQEAVLAGGGQVMLNSEVTNVTHENGIVTGITFKKDNQLRETPVSHLISSMPVSRLVSMLRPEAPKHVIEAAERLSYRAFVMVILIVDQKDLFADQWIYVHSPRLRVGRIQNFRNWSAAMAPDPDKTALGMEYFCNKDDEFWTMPDKELIETASQELKELGLAMIKDITDGCVVRQDHAYPVYDDDYMENLSIIKDYLRGIRNLQTIGRGGTHRYNNMDHSMLTGMLAVENYSGAAHDLWEVNDEKEYLEGDTRDAEIKKTVEIILDRTFARMDKLAFATATGVVSGVMVFLATIWLVIKGGEVVGPNLRLLEQFFAGYTVSVGGSFIAFGYSFFWGFIFGWLFAYLRNLFMGLYIFWINKKSEFLTLKDFFDYL